MDKSISGGYVCKLWTTLCFPKRVGGLGFKNPHLSNLAMLAKLAWRLLTEPEAPWVQVLRARYFTNKDLLTDDLPANGTWIWRNILQGLDIVKQHYIWATGNGRQIQPWKHHWLTTSTIPPPTPTSTGSQSTTEVISFHY